MKIFVKKKINNSYYSGKTEAYSYYVMEKISKNNVIIYIYPELTKEQYDLKENRLKNPLKPEGYTVKKFDNNLRELVPHNYGYYNCEITELKTTPKQEGLHIPAEYKHGEIKTSISKSDEITDEMLNKIRKKIDFSNPIIFIGEKLISDAENDERDNIIEYYHCNNIFSSNNLYNSPSIRCPICRATNYYNEIVMDEFKKHRQKEYDNKYKRSANLRDYPTTKKENFLYMTKKDDGIVLYKIVREITAKKDTIHEKFNIEYSIEHIVGKNIACYKHLKKEKKLSDPFEALNINSKNFDNPPKILYEGAEDFFEFATNNETFLKKSGFQTVLKYSSSVLELESFFIIFLCIMNKYPIMEQIVKMGHAKLFFTFYNSMKQSLSKTQINENVEKMSQLVDNEATKGKEALRFPSYIGDYLIKKDATINEYYYWRDLYEITKITKEQFENFIESFNFAWVNSQAELEDIGNILKFGYPLEKLFSYIVKQSKQHSIKIVDVIRNLTDYLNMCDICQIEADKYPQDVKKQHDDMLIYFRKREKVEYDKKLTLIGIECEKYVIPDENELNKIGIPKLFETMTIVFPKTEADFIDEGNQQHNCVGSYPNRVRNGNCVIFFIRKKDSSDKSFITAECTKNGLGQCFYSNNRYVNDENLINFAKYIANKIRTGCNSGKIHALQNID